MLNPTRGANWIARALTLGLTCVAITVGAHAAAGGAVPAIGIAFVALVMTLGSLLVTSRELSLAALSGFLVGSQAVCHLLLNGFGHAADSGGTSLAYSSERGAHALHAGAMPMSGTGDAAMSAHGMSNTMLIAHLVACTVAALVLREGERVMFSLHRALPNIMRVLLGLILNPRPMTLPTFLRQRVLVSFSGQNRSLRDGANVISRRGPPVGVRTLHFS